MFQCIGNKTTDHFFGGGGVIKSSRKNEHFCIRFPDLYLYSLKNFRMYFFLNLLTKMDYTSFNYLV